MARVTVEDCPVFSRFELVAISAQRARDIAAGSSLTLPRDKDKDTVVALREIAAGSITVDALRKSLKKRLECSVDNEDFLNELQDLCEDDVLEDVNDALLKAIENQDSEALSQDNDDDNDGESIEGLEIP